MGFLCPIWKQDCLQEKCVGYSTHTKEVFRDNKLERFIPIDDLEFYRNLQQEELDTRFDRIVSVNRSCKLLSTLIEKVETIDHLVPNTSQGHY